MGRDVMGRDGMGRDGTEGERRARAGRGGSGKAQPSERSGPPTRKHSGTP